MFCHELNAVEKTHSGDKPQGLVLPILSKPDATHLGYPTATSCLCTGAPLPITGSPWREDGLPAPSGVQSCSQHVSCSFSQVTNAFELYICYSPLGTKAGAINAVNKLMKWIRKEEDRLFILTPQTY